MTEILRVTAPLKHEDYFLNICAVIVKFASNSAFSALITRIRNEILIKENDENQCVKQLQERSTLAYSYENQFLEEEKFAQTQTEDEVLIFEESK